MFTIALGQIASIVGRTLPMVLITLVAMEILSLLGLMDLLGRVFGPLAMLFVSVRILGETSQDWAVWPKTGNDQRSNFHGYGTGFKNFIYCNTSVFCRATPLGRMGK